MADCGGAVAGLLDAGFEQVGRLEEEGCCAAGGEAGEEVEACGERERGLLVRVFTVRWSMLKWKVHVHLSIHTGMGSLPLLRSIGHGSLGCLSLHAAYEIFN